MKFNIILTALLTIFLSNVLVAEEPIATLRGAEMLIEPEPPMMNKTENKDERRVRAYVMQPPTIPHQIRDYRIDMNSNKCLFCHSRKKAPKMDAPMISVTHFQNREGTFLTDVSPRRFFCTQCHVPQDDTKPLVENTFIDATDLVHE